MVQTPPSAMRLPAAKGEKWNGFAGSCEPVKTGMLDSQAPRMKKVVIANQHMVAETPHCRQVILYGTGEGARVGASGVAVVTSVSVTLSELSSDRPAFFLFADEAERVERRAIGADVVVRGTSSKKTATAIQKMVQPAAMTHAGLVKPLNTELLKPTLNLRYNTLVT